MTITVIDTGFLLDHPNFTGRIWVNNLEISNNAIDDDDNGYKDDIFGWDFVNSDNSQLDDHGHGTNCASIIGAKIISGLSSSNIMTDVITYLQENNILLVVCMMKLIILILIILPRIL